MEDSKKTWNPLNLDKEDRNWIYSFRPHQSGYKIMVFNGYELLTEVLDERGLKSRNLELNPVVEAPIEDFLELLDSFLGKNTSHVQFQDDNTVLELGGNLMDFNFRWKFLLGPVQGPDLFQTINNNLLLGLKLLFKQTEYLKKTIEAKDMEIGDYEESGHRLTRKSLKTEKFKEQDLDSVHLDSEDESLKVMLTDNFQKLTRSLEAKKHRKISPSKLDSSRLKRKRNIKVRGIQIIDSDEEDLSPAKAAPPKIAKPILSEKILAKRAVAKKLKKL